MALVKPSTAVSAQQFGSEFVTQILEAELFVLLLCKL